MFNREKYESALARFKQDFIGRQWPNEKYKWEAVQWFQDHWDVNAPDFAGMLGAALKRTSNLLASMNNYPRKMIEAYAAQAPEEVRAMFIALYDETVDVWERIDAFKQSAAALRERLSPEVGQHYQNENVITTYLWLRYPDKYYIYKLGEVRNASQTLGGAYAFRNGAYADNIRNYLAFFNEIHDALSQDAEMTAMFREQLTPSCYPDPQYRTLTQTFCFYVSRFYSKETQGGPADEWLYADYTPGLTAEDWAALLSDPDVFNETSLTIMRRLKDYGGAATCTQLSRKYGEGINYYNTGASALARRVVEKTACPLPDLKDKAFHWWPVLFVGRSAGPEDEGVFIWRLRDALSQALDRVDLSKYPLYAGDTPFERFQKDIFSSAMFGRFSDDLGAYTGKFWKLSHGKEQTGLTDAQKHDCLQRNVIAMNKNTKSMAGMKTTQGEAFMQEMRVGDYFYLCYASRIVLLGQVTGDCVLRPELSEDWCERPYRVIAHSRTEAPYTGKQKWWTPNSNTTCIPVPEDEEDLFEQLILLPYFGMYTQEVWDYEFDKKKYTRASFLQDVYISEARYDRLKAVLLRKKNIILQGAPGGGKTFAARRLAWSIMGEKDDSRIEFVQFHQSYSYEDFVMGYKPEGSGFELKHGVFYRFCQKARNRPEQPHFFIIDEINRGNLSKIFGELLMLIEPDYRDTQVRLAYSDIAFSVPGNLYIIGMMNTADRSLALIDYALRRRFSFFDMEPGFDSEGFGRYQAGLRNETFNTLIDRIRELNGEIARDKALGKGFCIGHSYFCGLTRPEECATAWMQDVVDYDILQMLGEYWFDDAAKLQRWENILHGVFQ